MLFRSGEGLGVSRGIQVHGDIPSDWHLERCVCVAGHHHSGSHGEPSDRDNRDTWRQIPHVPALRGAGAGHELAKISPDPPANIRHRAKGTNPGDSGADLVSYDTESGGRVFSVGSLCWTLSITIDDGVSAVTANALRGMLE